MYSDEKNKTRTVIKTTTHNIRTLKSVIFKVIEIEPLPKLSQSQETLNGKYSFSANRLFSIGKK
jgi:hypothetical protein